MESIGTWYWYTGFAIFVLVAIVVDLLALESKGAKKVSFREALTWSIVWIALSFLFNALLWWYLDGKFGRELANVKAAEFFTGYLIEKSLAVDNIFVFLMLFTFFGVQPQYQRRVLILGVILAIMLRAIMILIPARRRRPHANPAATETLNVADALHEAASGASAGRRSHPPMAGH
jgi:tellurite resistance protein TerC